MSTCRVKHEHETPAHTADRDSEPLQKGELRTRPRTQEPPGSPQRAGLAHVVEAEAAIERLATAPADDGFTVRDIWLLRLRALLARAHGDAAAYAQFRDRYRDMARSLGFEGHIAWAKAIP